MDSEQTKRFVLRRSQGYTALLISEAIELSRRVDEEAERSINMNERLVRVEWFMQAHNFEQTMQQVRNLESAERERQPTPAPAAEQHLVASRQPDGTIDVDVVSAPPPEDVVRRADVLAAINDCKIPLLHFSMSAAAQLAAIIAAIPSASSPAPDVRAEALREAAEICDGISTVHNDGKWIHSGDSMRLTCAAAIRARITKEPTATATSRDQVVAAEMEMWKRCREALFDAGFRLAAIAAIDSCKPTAPAGTGGEGGGNAPAVGGPHPHNCICFECDQVLRTEPTP